MNTPQNRAATLLLASFALLLGRGAAAEGVADYAVPTERILRAEIELPAPVSDVWNAWTTDAGIATFFAPAGKVDLRVGGTYDVWFNPAGKPDERGAEGMRILDVEPMKRFVFTWNAPPSIPAIRHRWSVVTLEFEKVGETRTRLRFTHSGWGNGPEWDKAYSYFDSAWGTIVLPNLVYRFTKGPIDWNAPPTVTPVAPTLKMRLAEVVR
jgi:uncharacterized protein YndB with AHSA1/START domain